MGSMKKLNAFERARILHLLCEGSSIRAVTRLTGASKNTVIKLMIDAGKACAAHHDEHVRGVKARRVQCDEIWSFVHAKAKNVPTAKAAPEGAGDIWTWTALDADNKLILSWKVGGRDASYTLELMDDVRERLGEDCLLVRDARRGRVEGARGEGGEFGIRAVDTVEPQDPPIRTEVLLSGHAGRACAAGHEGVHDHPLPGLPGSNRGMDLLDGRDRFVAEDEPGLPALAVAEEPVNVRAADAGMVVAEEDLAGLGRGLRDLLDFDSARTGVDERLHG